MTQTLSNLSFALLYFCASWILFPLTAESQFHPSDANAIEDLSADLENASNLRSFEFFGYETSRIANASNFARVRFASLDINRSVFAREIQLESDRLAGFSIGARESVYQDLSSFHSRQMLDMTGRTDDGLTYGLIGYTDSFKKHADLGVELGHRPDSNDFINLYYVSTDHFYNDKETNGDRYRRKPWQAGLRGKHSTATLRLEFEYAYESPIRWHREESTKLYDYQHRWFDGRLAWEFAAESSLLAITHVSKKFEQSQYLPATYSLFSKRHDFDDTRVSIGLQRGPSSQSFTTLWIHYWHLGSNVDYFASDPNQTYETIASDIDSRHHMLEATRLSRLVEDGKHRLRWGLLVDHVRRSVDQVFTARTEWKFLFSWSIDAGESSVLSLQSAYDIDEIVTAFPYNKVFPGWDGGGIQMTFVL